MKINPVQLREFDSKKAEEFGARMIDQLNAGFLCLMTSIGHVTGLLDVMAELPPSSSAEIATAAGLNERYVREWLGAMVTGRIVEYDPASKTYHLPNEHAAAITRGAGPNNVATFMQYVGCMGGVERDIVNCFRNGGGLPYSKYERFHHLMADESGQVFDALLLDAILPQVPRLVDRLREGIDALDVACGSGHAVNLMAKEFPQSKFVGYELSPEAVEAARAEARSLGLGNVVFNILDVSKMNDRERFDLITTFDAIHDQAAPADVLRNVVNALRPTGVYLMSDIAASSDLQGNLGHPIAPFLYAVSTMHCMSVSLACDGAGLGAMWGEDLACRMLREAGFKRVEVKRIEGDIANNYYIADKS